MTNIEEKADVILSARASYAYDALAPYMSRETLEYHHDKHHLAYVDNGNNLGAYLQIVEVVAAVLNSSRVT